MIEEFVDLVPENLLRESGEIFYSGRAAFSAPVSIYILGRRPGDAPNDPRQRSVEENIKHVLHKAKPNWSSYRDECWNGKPAGTAPLQESVRHLAAQIGVDLGLVPSSNLVFTRSTLPALPEKKLIEMCWNFHAAVIERLHPKNIICLNVGTAEEVCRLLSGRVCEIDSLRQTTGQRQRHRVYSCGRLKIFGLVGQRFGKWTCASRDPSLLVQRQLEK